MADEVKPPESAGTPDPTSPPPPPPPAEGVQIAPPSPGKTDAPAVEGEKKGPNKMVLAAGGGAVAIILVVILIMGLVSCLSTSYKVPGVSPDLDEPKKAGASYIEFRWEKHRILTLMMNKHAEEDNSFEESMAEFYEDPALHKKENIEKGKARREAFNKNKKDLLEWNKDKLSWDSEEGTDERKTLKFKYEYKSLQLKIADNKPMEGDKPDHYEVKDQKETGTIVVAKLGGKWRLVSAQSEPMGLFGRAMGGGHDVQPD